MSTSCTIRSIARHHLYETDIQPEFRQFEIAKLDQDTMDSMIEDVEKVISDYKVTSAERHKHINNEMLMLGPCDSDSHTPLLVYIHSLAADQERNYHRKKEHNQNKKKENETAWKPWNQSYQQGWKSSGYQKWENYGGGDASQSDSSYRWYSQTAMRYYDNNPRSEPSHGKRHHEFQSIDPPAHQDYARE